MWHSLVRFMLVVSSIALCLGFWKRNELPSPSWLLPQLQPPPMQSKVALSPFEKTVGGISYRIQPLYAYELTGLVVSQHDTTSWQGSMHRRTNDNLNVRDVCVVWGENALRGIYQHIKFWNGQFTCNFFTRSEAAYRAFDQAAFSNNHLLAASASIQEKLAGVKLGDQIHLKGYLATYSHNHGFPFRRGTSTVRTDTGNGACETIYVEEVSIIRPWMSPWRLLMYVAMALLALSILAWMVLPFEVRDSGTATGQ